LKQVLIRKGSAVVADVPAPTVGARSILVRVAHSCISVGTETAGVRMSAMPLYKRALKQPHNIRKALEMMRDYGVLRTLDRIRGTLDAGVPTGYSASGSVVAVGDEVEGFAAGDVVACAGAGIANHAEVIDVPVNLAVKVPKGLGTEVASTVTLGAIALQGVRRANPTLGETVLVIGLGIIGQITVQLLRANGCRVIGLDLDPGRVRTAKENGLEHGIDPATEPCVERVRMLTEGRGADAAIVTAATSSSEVIGEAFRACRRKGRVVLVGDVGLNLNRADIYPGELDFLVSTSYGPGRYDPYYEEQGLDYPLAYVRWTENRNMEEYLRLLAEKRISIGSLRSLTFEIFHAEQAYAAIQGGGDKPLLVLLSYPDRPRIFERAVEIRTPVPKSGKIGVAVAGAGGFAQGMHLPNLAKLAARCELRVVMSRTGSNAAAVAKRFEAAKATTDYQAVLSDPDVDLVVIATRHDLHARMALQALLAGKHVLVEKPLAITQSELDEIEAFFRGRTDTPVLMTGFNRRFSPAVRRAAEVLQDRSTPMILNYRMNAGYLPREHWVHGPEGGGRNIGEACHIYDLFNFLSRTPYENVEAAAIRPAGQWARNDNFVATVTYADGSVCTLTYTALGEKSFPKERMEIFADGKVVFLDDYRSLAIAGGQHRGWSSRNIEKGQFQELEALLSCVQEGGAWPIPLPEQLAATKISLEVEKKLSDHS
jgi:predicted dehydrogenase/threonine dehydrogenase-like Zn-dependent dehydrogenase